MTEGGRRRRDGEDGGAEFICEMDGLDSEPESAAPLQLRVHGQLVPISLAAARRADHLRVVLECDAFEDRVVEIPSRHSVCAVRAAVELLEAATPLRSVRDAGTHEYKVTTRSALDVVCGDAKTLCDVFLFGAYLGAPLLMDASSAHLTALVSEASPESAFSVLGVRWEEMCDAESRARLRELADEWRRFAALSIDEDAWREARAAVAAATTATTATAAKTDA